MTSSPSRNKLRIGELARLAEVSPRTIRFYVSQGLLPQPEKTHRNMAYYSESCISMIKAIKKAQTERFLPLVAIRQMLEENGFDHASLDVQEPPDIDSADMVKSGEDKSRSLENFPTEILQELSARDWAPPLKPEAGSAGEPGSEQAGGLLFDFLNDCHDNGLEWRESIEALDTIKDLTERLVECEFKVFLRRLAHQKTPSFNHFLNKEKRVIREFVNRTRERSLSRILRSHNQNLDNALFAVSDEGYGIPIEEIEDDLKKMENSLEADNPDIRVLVDLATGYSCTGALKRSASFLYRALKQDPEDVAALVRLCWYNRFSEADFLESGQFSTKRDYLAHIVSRSPEHMFGRLSLSIWFACDSLEADDSYESMRLINSSLSELRAAESMEPANLHDWCLVHYLTGLLLTCILPSLGELDKGIEALEAIRNRKDELEDYYSGRMPFFPKWLWPNLFSLLGSAYMEKNRRAEATDAFREANRFKVSPLFRKRLEENLQSANERLQRRTSV